MSGFLSAIPKNLPKPSACDNTLKLTTPEESSLDRLEKKYEKELAKDDKSIVLPKNWKTKETTEWNKKDLLVYFYARYRDAYHAKLTNNIPWQQDYASMEDIAVMIQKQLKVEVGNPIMRQYFDWAFDSNYINETLTRKNKFTLLDLKRERPVLNFVQTIRRGSVETAKAMIAPEAAHTPQVDAVASQPHIPLDDLAAAYSIHSQYFLEAYGFMIPINYLMIVKGKSEAEAIAYVQKAIEKIRASQKGEQKLTRIAETTVKYGPYPKWFPFLKFQAFTEANVAISDDSGMYQSFKEQISK
jgi:hypothetical protein